MEQKMKYIINYQSDGKILGFHNDIQPNYLNIEVDNKTWFNNMGMNKIIIDMGNISFDKVDWRTKEEVDVEILENQKQEALAYLSNTDWYVTRKMETGVEIPLDVLTKRAEARLLI